MMSADKIDYPPIPERLVAPCRAVIDHHSKSFALAAKLLPTHAQSGALVAYAWCRRADDLIDNADPSQASLDSKLDQLREELDYIYAGRPMDDPVLSAFAHLVRQRSIPRLYPDELLAGMAMDAGGVSYENVRDLLLYCHRVAGVVGLMMCHVLGIADDRALVLAANLGIAMQITNICRDVVEDWQRGRCYLPADLIPSQACRILRNPPLDKLPDTVRDDLRRPLEQLLSLADRYYRQGDAGLVYLDVRSAWAIRSARRIYSAIGDEIARRRFDVAAGRAYTSSPQKLAFLVESLGKSLASLPRRWARPVIVRLPTQVLEYPQASFIDGTAPSLGER